MKHKWKNKYEFEVGAAMPVDPQHLPHHGRRKYLRCPLCLEACTEAYWNHHVKYLHLQCPLCLQWFSKAQGLSMHLTRSQCGYEILTAMDRLFEEPLKREFIIRIV